LLEAQKKVVSILMKGTIPVRDITGDGILTKCSAVDYLPAFEVPSLETGILRAWVTCNVTVFGMG
jgi:hypothetical protein